MFTTAQNGTMAATVPVDVSRCNPTTCLVKCELSVHDFKELSVFYGQTRLVVVFSCAKKRVS